MEGWHIEGARSCGQDDGTWGPWVPIWSPDPPRVRFQLRNPDGSWFDVESGTIVHRVEGGS